MKNKIVIDARESGTTTGRYIDKLIEYLGKIDHRHNIIVLTKSDRVKHLSRVSPKLRFIGVDILEFSFAEQLKFLRIINKLRPDLVHFGMTQQPIFYRRTKITTVHDLTTVKFRNQSKNYLLFKTKQLVYAYVIKNISKKSSLVITPSNFVKNDLIKFTGVNSAKIVVTHESADTIKASPRPVKILLDKQFIMYTGRATIHKNLYRLAEAHQILIENNRDLFLAFSGKMDANYLALKKYINQNKYQQVVFTDYLTEGELRWMYQNAMAYIFPSLSEGFGLTGLEAMIHNCPVISSSATCLPEIYGDAAVYFNPLNVEEISKSIDLVINDEALRKRLLENGLKQVAKYSWLRMTRRTLEAYDDAIEMAKNKKIYS